MGARGWGEGLTVNGHTTSFGDVEYILGLDSHDGCTTLVNILKLLTCILKKDKFYSMWFISQNYKR